MKDTREESTAAGRPALSEAEASGPRRPEAERWRERQVLGRADMRAAGVAGVAILLTALPLWRGPQEGDPPAFVTLAPLGGAALFAVLLYMFAERHRHGWARLTLTGIGLLLAVAATAFSFTGRVHAGALLLSYWLPALLSVAAAVILTWAHQGLAQRATVRLKRRERTQHRGP